MTEAKRSLVGQFWVRITARLSGDPFRWSAGGKKSIGRLTRMRGVERQSSSCLSRSDCKDRSRSNPMGQWAHVFHAADRLQIVVD